MRTWVISVARPISCAKRRPRTPLDHHKRIAVATHASGSLSLNLVAAVRTPSSIAARYRKVRSEDSLGIGPLLTGEARSALPRPLPAPPPPAFHIPYEAQAPHQYA